MPTKFPTVAPHERRHYHLEVEVATGRVSIMDHVHRVVVAGHTHASPIDVVITGPSCSTRQEAREVRAAFLRLKGRGK